MHKNLPLLFLLFLLPFIFLLYNLDIKKKDVKKEENLKQNIIVYQPTPNQKINTKFRLSGKSKVFDKTFTFRLKNNRTNTVYAESATINDSKEPGQFGNFNFEVDFAGNAPDLKDQDPLILEVFQKSPQDGKELDKVTIPLIHNSP